jgi:hypothetical protein
MGQEIDVEIKIFREKHELESNIQEKIMCKIQGPFSKKRTCGGHIDSKRCWYLEG